MIESTGNINAEESGKHTIAAILPLHIEWTPKTDITTHELAMCMPILIAGSMRRLMPYDVDQNQEYMRHFKIYDRNK